VTVKSPIGPITQTRVFITKLNPVIDAYLFYHEQRDASIT